MAKAAHHRGTHQRRAKAVTDAAYANPDTVCMKAQADGTICGLTLDQHEPHHNGTPATWDAGHVNDGEIAALSAVRDGMNTEPPAPLREDSTP